MTREDKELLLKDLCSRLPYGVKISFLSWDEREMEYIDRVDVLYSVNGDEYIKSVNEDYDFNLEDIKPYLFPLSSMTEEQYEVWCDLEANPLDEILTRNVNGEKMSTLEHHLLVAKSLTGPVNYCYKNHFDIYGLIEKGLAIDATGLNIY